MIDFALWDLKNEFTFDEASRLWFEIDPYKTYTKNEVPEEIWTKVVVIENVLRKTCREHRLEGYKPYSWLSDSPATISREGLKECARRFKHKPLFLFPEEREISANPATQKNATKPETPVFKHSEDYRSVLWKGRNFSFTSQQAQVVELLHQAYENGTPEIGKDYVLVKLGSQSSRLRDTFKNHEAWGTLIVKGAKQGTYRLDI